MKDQVKNEALVQIKAVLEGQSTYPGRADGKYLKGIRVKNVMVVLMKAMLEGKYCISSENIGWELSEKCDEGNVGG